MDMTVSFSILAACGALAAILAALAVYALKREPAHLKERAKNGEILLLTFEQVMALYDSAPEKWELEVDGPIYYPQGKEQEGLLVFLLPRERKRYRAWFDWRLSHGEEERQSRMTAQALLSMQEDLARHLRALQETNEKALEAVSYTHLDVYKRQVWHPLSDRGGRGRKRRQHPDL